METEECIDLGCNTLGVSDAINKKAKLMLSHLDLKKPPLSKASPKTIAATLVYLAGILCGERISQNKLYEISGVCGATIRRLYPSIMLDLPFDLGGMDYGKSIKSGN